jgi:phosphoglycerate dehydrogenase-like enzyme
MEEHYEKIVGMKDLGEVLKGADIVVLALPLTEKTKGLMNADMFAKMKQGAILVNVARGAIVDEEALIGALEEKLGGAVLDVFTEEPLGENSPLWDMDHVIVTPHNSFVGEGNGKRLADVIMKGFKGI